MMRTWFITLGLLLSSHLVWAQEFSAYLSKGEVPLGEVFQVTFELKGARGAQVEYPAFDGFAVRGGPNLSQSVQIVNGQVSQTVSYSFYLQGTREGTFTIAAAQVEVEGKTLRSEPMRVKIVPARSSGSGRNAARDQGDQQRQADLESQLAEAVFVRALVSEREVYQGEQLTVTYKLYRRARTSDPQLAGNPSYEGFWVETVDIRDPVPRMEVIDGQQYQSHVIKQDILFPQRPGELTIDPLKLTCMVRVQATRQRQRRSILDSFFGQYENYQYEFASRPVRIDVKPLPSGRPASFSGVVGNLALDVTLDTTQAETGEPLTLRVALAGQGNIKKLQEPDLKLPPDFEVYDPNISESISRRSGVLKGKRSYEYLIIPRNPGTFQVPPIRYSFFDPSSGRYQTLRSPEFAVTVTGQAQQVSSPSLAGSGEQTDVALLDQDIRFIHNEPGRLRAPGSTFLLTWQFWLLYLLPMLAIAGLWAVKRRQMRDRRDVAGTRRRRAAKVAQKRLSVAQQHLRDGTEKAFYDEVVRALWGYLGNKFNLGQSELSRERAAELLRAQGTHEALIQRLHALLDTCEMALFAPNAAPGGMQGTYDQASHLIADLEDHKLTPQATV